MTEQYILLPRRGLRPQPNQGTQVLRLLSRAEAPPYESIRDREFALIDTIAQGGPTLVQVEDRSHAAAVAKQTGRRAVPLTSYPEPNPQPSPAAVPATPVTSEPIHIHVEDAQSGASLAGVHIVAYDRVPYSGTSGVTDANGDVRLIIASPELERLEAHPRSGYWGSYRVNVSARSPRIEVRLEPVDLTYTDAVRHYYRATQFDPRAGVKVAVIDTGVGPHRDLNVVEAANTVTGEPDTLCDDANGHGTHVAGLVGASGAPPSGLAGIAPGVQIHAYRVFGAGPSTGATNYSILKAMFLADEAGCDIVNLSLGGGPWDDIVAEAIFDARQRGMLIVIAAGNGGRAPVSFPGAYPGATPVSAMGREGTFPAGSPDELQVLRPPTAHDQLEFLAAFSNVGEQVKVIAPGVGLLSTLPGNAFGPLSGTSMAAPVVTGAAASLLSRNSHILAMPRDQARSTAIEQLLYANCLSRGFGLESEGHGMPNPANI